MLLFWWHNKIKDFDVNSILIDEKSHDNTLLYNVSCKTLIGTKPLLIRFDKINGFIRVYDGTRYLVLFRHEKYRVISADLDVL